LKGQSKQQSDSEKRKFYWMAHCQSSNKPSIAGLVHLTFGHKKEEGGGRMTRKGEEAEYHEEE